jgi:hypothetical protein
VELVSKLDFVLFCFVSLKTQRTKQFWNYGEKYCFDVVCIHMARFRYDRNGIRVLDRNRKFRVWFDSM